MNLSTLEKKVNKYVREDIAREHSGIHIYWKMHLFTQRKFLTEGDARAFVTATLMTIMNWDSSQAKKSATFLESIGLIQIA